MGNKNKGGREVRKPKKNAKAKGAPIATTVLPNVPRPTTEDKPK